MNVLGTRVSVLRSLQQSGYLFVLHLVAIARHVDCPVLSGLSGFACSYKKKYICDPQWALSTTA